jgi:hypothetical protein
MGIAVAKAAIAVPHSASVMPTLMLAPALNLRPQKRLRSLVKIMPDSAGVYFLK